jgi:hypothetical protein
MAHTIQDEIANEFPNLYHFGPATNRAQIELFRSIFSADLIRGFGARSPKPPVRRLGREVVHTPLGSFLLNDQGALKYGHVKHPDSLPENEFVDLLDQLTFFWPGDSHEPIEMGVNFRSRYAKRGDNLLQIMLGTRDFFVVNHAWRIFISTCNSGSPRSNPHAVIYRGYETFRPLLSYPGSVTDIKEIAVLGYARLPDFRLTEIEGAAETTAPVDDSGPSPRGDS